MPRVGDAVTFTFQLDYALPGGFDCRSDRCVFLGGDPFLSGDMPPMSAAREVVVQRRAVQPGIATVRLDLTGRTEEECLFEDALGCSRYFRPTFIESSSGPLTVEVLPAPTDTPMRTPTATPTPTQRRPTDDDGCAIRPRAGVGPLRSTLMLLPALWLMRRRRR